MNPCESSTDLSLPPMLPPLAREGVQACPINEIVEMNDAPLLPFTRRDPMQRTGPRCCLPMRFRQPTEEDIRQPFPLGRRYVVLKRARTEPALHSSLIYEPNDHPGNLLSQTIREVTMAWGERIPSLKASLNGFPPGSRSITRHVQANIPAIQREPDAAPRNDADFLREPPLYGVDQS